MPTFGDTSAGGSTFPCSGDRALLGRFQLTENGNLTEIVVRFDSTSTSGSSFKGLIYSDGAGVPLTRLGIGATVAVPAGGGNLSSALALALSAGFYWIGAVTDDFQSVFQMDATGIASSRMEAATYASPAATWAESGTSAAQMNVYGTYTQNIAPWVNQRQMGVGQISRQQRIG